MEVLVTFLEGDPDQPLITGCLYHKEKRRPLRPAGEQKPAAPSKPSVPRAARATTSFASKTKKGAEQIYLHAQRDWDENIEHDQKNSRRQ